MFLLVPGRIECKAVVLSLSASRYLSPLVPVANMPAAGATCQNFNSR